MRLGGVLKNGEARRIDIGSEIERVPKIGMTHFGRPIPIGHPRAMTGIEASRRELQHRAESGIATAARAARPGIAIFFAMDLPSSFKRQQTTLTRPATNRLDPEVDRNQTLTGLSPKWAMTRR
jgi:hypothetical protein